MFISILSTCFEQLCAHHQESQLYQYDIWYMVYDFNTIDSPDDEQMVARNM